MSEERADLVSRAMLDALTDPLFERSEGDVVPALIGDQLVFECTVEAGTLADAVGRVAEALAEIADAADGSLAGGTAAGLHGWAPSFRVEASVSDLALA